MERLYGTQNNCGKFVGIRMTINRNDVLFSIFCCIFALAKRCSK